MKLACKIIPIFNKNHIDINKSGIYIIKNIINKKVYVGSTIRFRKRFKEHLSGLLYNKHKNQKIQNHVNKYGINSISIEILEICEKDVLLEKEIFYAKLYNSFDEGFNMADITRNKGRVFTKEEKEKLSIRYKGINNPNYGKKHSQETKDYISFCNKNKIKTITEEGKKRIIESLKNRIITPKKREHARKIGNRIRTIEDNENFSKIRRLNSPNIFQFDLNGNFIKEWNSIPDIEEFYNWKNTDIGRVCKYLQNPIEYKVKNRKSRICKSSKGFIWKYNNLT